MQANISDNTMISDLISVCNDSRQFYELAAEEIDNTELSLVYSHMAEVRAEISKNLIKRVQQMGKNLSEGSQITGEMRNAYTRLRDSFCQHPNYIYLSRLEEPENQALRTLTQGVTEIEDRLLAAEISEYLRMIKTSCNRLRVMRETSRFRSDDFASVKH